MPDTHVIPENIRKFIFENIDSVAQLEGLLLLRADANNGYSADDIAKRLYISQSESEQLLSQLCERGFIVRDSSSQLYLYKPESDELDHMVENLTHIYAQYLLPVTHFIHSKSKSRIQEFANAFRIRKD